MKLGDSAEVILPSKERKYKAVCNECNMGWMSTLEKDTTPLLGSLLNDMALPLDDSDKELLSRWVMKTSMVWDAVVHRDRELCYKSTDRQALRTTGELPELTAVWAGRFSGSSLAHFGTDIWLTIRGIQKAGNGGVATLVIGHCVFQVMTLYVAAEQRQYGDGPTFIQPKPGVPWDEILVPIWPGSSRVSWPPSLTFTNDGGRLTIGRLMDRWRIGLNSRA